MNQFTKEQLLYIFPLLKPRAINTAIKFLNENTNIQITDLKCLNSNCKNIRKWNSNGIESKYTYTCGGTTCKENCKLLIKQLRGDKVKSTNLERYGVTSTAKLQSTKQKAINTYINKYNTTHPMKLQKIKQKAITTCVNKYGVQNPLQAEQFKLKSKETYFDRTGFIHNSHNPESNKKRKETCLINFGSNFPLQNQEVKQKVRETYKQRTGYSNPACNPIVIRNKQDLYSNIINREQFNNKQFWIENFLTEDNNFDKYKAMDYFNCQSVWLYIQIKKLNIEYTKFKGTSLKEQALIPILEALQITNIVTNSRTIIPPLELDIYLPDLDLAIEYNGAYWHQDSKKPVDYHQSKSIACLSKGIRLLHIFEGYNDYNLEETLKEFLNYIPSKETGVFDLSTGCYPLGQDYKIQEPELINIMGFNIYDAGKIYLN